MWNKGKIYFFKPREPLFDSNTIVINDEKTMVVDPGTQSKDFFKETLQEANTRINDVDLVFNTHSHYDHFQGNKHFPKAEKISFKPDSEKISRKTKEELTEISSETEISTGELTFKVLHTPGHSKGSCSLYLKDEILICGDLVFSNGSYGRTDLPGGSKKDLEKSLKKVNKLCFKHLLPGHRGAGDKSSIEKSIRLIQRY